MLDIGRSYPREVVKTIMHQRGFSCKVWLIWDKLWVMSKWFVRSYIFLIILSIFCVFPPKASAYITQAQGDEGLGNYTFQLNFFRPGLSDESESQRVVESGVTRLSVTVYDKDGTQVSDFFRGKNYYFGLKNPKGETCLRYYGGLPDPRYRTVSLGSFQQGGEQDIWAEIFPYGLRSNQNCSNFEPGVWSISVWQNNETPKNKDYIFTAAKFLVEGQQGGLPTSIDFIDGQESSKLVCSNRTTQVKLINTVQNQTYTFWWDGAQTNVAAKIKASQKNAVEITNISGDGLDPANDSPKLCMQEGDISPIRGRCDAPGKFLLFTRPKDPAVCLKPTEAQCSLENTSVGLTDQFKVTVTGTNFSPNTNYKGVLAENSTVQTTEVDKNSDNSGSILFDFGNHPTGDYSFSAVNANGTEVCSVSKNLSSQSLQNPPAAKPPGVICAENPKSRECSKAGGQGCSNGSEGVMTAIGCVPTQPKAFVEGVLKFVTFFAGGLALLLMILGALQMITAEGNPENIKNAQEKFYSAIIGLLFIIFAVLLLQVIGVDILGLPGFSR